ncbi:spore germination protein [Paenibacillus sp. MBLB2552]|uniref:Spore germination protein n=1 Tax=Paenibacillus mellifer TaxID=2937794 RepID=A0A9X1XVR8_9BACL|nr:GerAB/ArcD/ProY family transporter [Paenibacillus mellifer]MCK8485716.1 spore germination protein [Paenibacillus mellifer]
MDREKLNRFHIALMVFNTQNGIVLFTLPRLTARYFGTNGWLMLIPMFLFVTLNIMLISAVYRMGRGKSVFDILGASVPRFILIPLYVVLWALFSMIGCLVIRQYALIYQMLIFPTTSDMVLKMFVDVLVFLYVVKGIYTMSKANVIFSLLLLIQIPLAFFFIREFDLARLTPFLFQEGTDMIEGFIRLYGAYMGYELCLFLFPYAENNKRWLKYIHLGNGITMFVFWLVAFLAYGFFGHKTLTHSSFPILNLFAYLRFPFIERIQYFLFSLYLFSVLHTGGMYYWSSQAVMTQIFRRISWKLVVFLSMAATIAVGMIPRSLIEVESWFRYLTIAQLSFSLGFPLLLILLLLLQRRFKKHA